MPYRLPTQKLVPMTLATLAGAAMCGLFAFILMVTGALAA